MTNQPLILRPATLADLPVLQPFAVQTWRTAFAHSYADPADPQQYIAEELSAVSFARALQAGDTIVLGLQATAAGADQLLGYLQIGPAEFADLKTQPGDQDLRRLYVASHRLGEGIGRQLLDAALALPAVQQANNIYLDVWEKNTRAQKLYHSYGFRVIAERRYVSQSGAPADLDYQMCRRQPRAGSVL